MTTSKRRTFRVARSWVDPRDLGECMVTLEEVNDGRGDGGRTASGSAHQMLDWLHHAPDKTVTQVILKFTEFLMEYAQLIKDGRP